MYAFIADLIMKKDRNYLNIPWAPELINLCLLHPSLLLPRSPHLIIWIYIQPVPQVRK